MSRRLKNHVWAALTVLMLWSCSAEGSEISGKVVGVHDGDSITLLTAEKREVKVRLEGIDAPELKQPFGNASKQSLSELVFGKNVRVQVTGMDRYKRTLGHVFIGEVWVNLAQVERGLAWHYKKYSKDETLSESEVRARGELLGLWREGTAVPPWEWRAVKK